MPSRPWIKVYRSLTPKYQAMSNAAQGQGLRVLVMCDDQGVIAVGRKEEGVDYVVERLCLWLGVKGRERIRARKSLHELFDNGFLELHPEGACAPNFVTYQADKRSKSVGKRSVSGTQTVSKRLTNGSPVVSEPSGTGQQSVSSREITARNHSPPNSALLREEERRGDKEEIETKTRARVTQNLSFAHQLRMALEDALRDAGLGERDFGSDHYRFEVAASKWKPPSSDLVGVAQTAAANFVADPWVKSQGCSMRLFVSDPAKYFAMSAQVEPELGADIEVDPRFIEEVAQ